MTAGTLSGARLIMAQKMFMHRSNEKSRGFYVLGTALCGHPNVVHGGVLATLLDEGLGWLVIARLGKGVNAVTARLEVNYRRPVIALNDEWGRALGGGGLVFLEAEVAEVVDGRKAVVKGTMKDEEGKVLVEAEAVFVVPRGWKPRPLIES